MIVAIDIGNTNIKLGVFDGKKLLASWRMASDLYKTADEYGVLAIQLMNSQHIDTAGIKGGIISSVIPQLNYTVGHMLDYYFDVKPLIVGAGVKNGLNIKYENSKELGTDRIVNCVGALHRYGAPFILIDFGTATTFNAVNEKGEFIGGAITVGVKTSVEALAVSTAKLPRVEIQKVRKAIGNTTVKNIQSGLYFGVVGQTNALIKAMKAEMNVGGIKVIATGGLSEIFASDCDIDVIDRGLSLDGLRIIYGLNKTDA